MSTATTSSRQSNDDGISNSCLKVFFPQQYCNCSSGYLLGFTVNSKTICISSVHRSYDRQFSDATSSKLDPSSTQQTPVVLGYIYNQDEEDQPNITRQFRRHRQWILIQVSWKSRYCYVQWHHHSQLSFLLIVYQQNGKGTFMSNRSLHQVVMEASDINHHCASEHCPSELESCLQYISMTQNLSFNRAPIPTKNQLFHIADFLFLTWFLHLVSYIYLKFRTITLPLCKYLQSPLQTFRSYFRGLTVNQIACCSSTVYRIIKRVKEFKHLYHSRQQFTNDYRVSQVKSVQKMIFCNYAITLMLDILLGLAFFYLFFSYDLVEKISAHFMNLTQVTVNSLTKLLNWLMGAPVGLKLNKPLSEFLANFFLYHIYVWNGYLQFMRGYLNAIIIVLFSSSFLGISLFIALLADALSLLTFHMYCFYIYAARIYSLQIFSISSLYHLCRGKKWNVLKNRMDSYTYDIDQLFLGTLLFTILVFLLPTTLVFYIVFTTLRLSIMSLYCCLNGFLWIIDHLLLYVLFLKILNPNCLSDGIEFQKYNIRTFFDTGSVTNFRHTFTPGNEIEAQCFFLKNKNIGWNIFWIPWYRIRDFSNNFNYTIDFMQIIKMLATGKIISPLHLSKSVSI
ncbi:Phosphatidylinositol N-acetylglucosaminyltransferase subunit Q [Trichoplax sp. H2]|nr:Phosphatidylinositol N-acetylglucosaminyltransferase subunit Q [Trichoplax sp. H2]|eukprot:RDD42048.1 Phosphatidylinositol N-acetylglucosaminyltransferase subunit Q [Trichoplax sp. H2]